VNVTNDAWFGNTPGPYQHLRQAQVRAVELGLPLLRAVNNGISAVIDANGRIGDALAIDAVGAIVAVLPLRRGQNPHVGTARANGLLIVFLMALFGFTMILKVKRRIN